MNQKKSKRLRREFRETGGVEKTFKTEKKTRLKFEKDKISTEEYDDIVTTNNYRRFKKRKK